ncbi:MAG: hypothetical protein NC548_20435 [Lachnospiraceae bacterium]|nr:hypothetical protein [Lachnospiraceae bacterium]
MLKKTITYKDYNDVERTEDFYFNLSKAEAMEMELSITGGLTEMIRKIVAAQDTPTIIATFKQIILKAYGEKSPDGRRFIKSEELSKAFSETEAYSILYMELATDANAAAEFVNGIVPKDATAPAAQQGAAPVLAAVTN